MFINSWYGARKTHMQNNNNLALIKTINFVSRAIQEQITIMQEQYLIDLFLYALSFYFKFKLARIFRVLCMSCSRFNYMIYIVIWYVNCSYAISL